MTNHTSWCHPHSAQRFLKWTGSALAVPIGRGGTCRGRFRPRSGAVFPRSDPYRSLTARGNLSLSGINGVLRRPHGGGPNIQLPAIIVRLGSKSQGSGALMVQFVLGIDDIPPVHIATVHTQHQHLGGSYVGGKGDIVLVAQTGDVEQLLVHGGIIGIYKK